MESSGVSHRLLPCCPPQGARFGTGFRQSRPKSFRIDALMTHKVTLLPGEGIGPEVAVHTKRVLEASGVQIGWEDLDARALNTDKSTVRGEVLNTAAIDFVRPNRGALKGPRH